MSRKRKRNTTRKRSPARPTPESRPAAPARGRGTDLWVGLALVVLVLLAYGNAIDAPFVYDDHGSIVENASVHWHEVGVEQLGAAWLKSPTRRFVANWSFGLDHRFFGLDPRAYHATNLIIHAVACVLLYWLLLQLLQRHGPTVLDETDLRLAAGIGAAVFAVHPLGTQVVTYVVQRMAGLAAMFCIASLIFYLRGRDVGGRARAAWWTGAVVAWGLALGSKESAASFPAVILLYEWLFHRGADRRTATRLLVPVGVAAVIALGVMRVNYGDPFRDTFYHDFTLGDRLLSQARVLSYYVGLIAWPAPSRLTLMHDFVPSRGWFVPWTTLPAWIGVAAALMWAAVWSERRPLGVFALGWFGLALAVETSIFPLRLVHEHRLYLPLAGVSIAVAAVVRAGLPSRRPWVVAVACIVLSLLILATRERNEVWRDRASVWADVIEKSPGLGIGYANLAAIQILEERYEEAEALLERGGLADPNYPGIDRGLGVIQVMRGEREAALSLLQRVIVRDPLDHAAIAQIGILLVQLDRPDEALRYFEESTRIFEHPLVVNHHGKALARLGRLDEAIRLHRRALALAPDDGFVHVALGFALAAVGRVDEGRALLERAVELDDPASAHVELASLDWGAGRPASAIAHLRQALALDAESSVAQNNLAWMLSTAADPGLRDPERALELVDAAEAGFEESDPDLLDARAAALAAAGRPDQAVAAALDAAEAARARGKPELAADIEDRIEIYRGGGVYVDPSSAGGGR